MRYSGQGWEIPISLSEAQAMNPSASVFEARFNEDYTKLFGRPVAGLDVEITVWSVNATTPAEVVTSVDETSANTAAKALGTRALFDPATARTVSSPVAERGDISAGNFVEGPAAITEAETTIIVPSGFLAVGQSDGCIDLRKGVSGS